MEIETEMKMIKAEAEAVRTPKGRMKATFLFDAKMIVAMVESRSMTHAGYVVGKSQSAVSRKLAEWERNLGFQLAHRHCRGLVPTQKGAEVYKVCKKLIDDIEAVKRLHIDESAELHRQRNERNERIVAAYKSGAVTMAELGKIHDLSRQAIHQIIAKECKTEETSEEATP